MKEERSEDRRSLLSSALLKLERMQARLEAAERSRNEPVAIIGLGCRFPGGANDPDRYWELLRNGVDAVREVPAERWNAGEYYDPDRDAPGKSYTKSGGFLDQIDRFDPQFFNISPREALTLDPQQRLVLEVAWEALEHAGQAPARLRGTQSGVFIGIGSSDYAQLQMAGGVETIDAYTGSGGGVCFAAGRLAYCLGLQGPALAVDTACSSSLVAVHLACQSLRASECRLALAGGVNVIASPDLFVYLSRAKALAPDGRSKVFDAAADGFVRGEGCGVVVLKRLSDAVADGDTILALIRGSAVNQDGASGGLTVPNGPAQQAVIAEALARAGVAPADIDFVETHGTGTSLGDPIETGALTAALSPGRPPGRRLTIASVKTNIGHLEAAAGIAGLIKVVLALQNEEIPSHLHFRRLNPAISFGSVEVVIPTRSQPWPASVRRLAGVSAFGLSGTNAHVVVEGAPAQPQGARNADRPVHLLALSARSADALNALAGSYERRLATHPELEAADICFTANAGRSHFAHRLAIVAPTVERIRERLAEFGRAAGSVVLAGSFGPSHRPKIAFLFTGQGSQYPGMAQRLYQVDHTFRRAFDEADEALRGHLGRPIADVIGAGDGQTFDSRYVQPALFAVEYALAELWRSWGVEPSVVVGHSIGEYAAACIAGVMSMEAAAKLVAARGSLMDRLPSGGAMAAAAAGADRIQAAIARAGAGDVSIAALNAPESVVISGAMAAVLAVTKELEAQGIRTRPLAVSHAFHSPLIAPMLDAFESVARTVAFSPPRVPWISTSTGELVTGAVDAAYWRRQTIGTVRFADAVAAMRERGVDLGVEIGPAPVLVGLARQCGIDGAGWVGSLRRGRDDWEEILTALATLYVHGAAVDWVSFDRHYVRRKVALPAYPFQRERYWSQPAPKRSAQPPAEEAGEHPLLRREVRSPLLTAHVYEAEIGVDTHPFLADHRVFGNVVFPAAAYLEMVLAAVRKSLGEAPRLLRDVAIGEALTFAEGERRTVQTVVELLNKDAAAFKVYSRPSSGGGEWKLHASGTVRSGDGAAPPVAVDAIRARCPLPVQVAAQYEKVAGFGVEFGPAFRGLIDLAAGQGEAVGRIALVEGLRPGAAAFHIHPALLDAGLQVLGAAMAGEVEDTYLPVGLDSFALFGAAPQQLWSHAALRAPASGGESLTADVTLVDDHGSVIAVAAGLHLKRASRLAEPADEWLYHTQWRAEPRAARESGRAGRLPGAETVAAQLDAALPALREEFRIEQFKDLLPSLDALARAYFLKALRRLGWMLEAGDQVELDTLAARLGIVARHRPVLSRSLQILEQQGILKREGEAWRVVRPAPDEEPERLGEEAARRFPVCQVELNLISRCGGALSEVLLGRADALQLLFPEGSLSEAERLYQDSPFARLYNAAVSSAVSTALARATGGASLRVLEVGAGTGGTTLSVLRQMPPAGIEYVFTDISPAFLAHGRRKFAEFPFLRYKILDIERDPREQGFAAHSFDIVVAANVLHATADLRQTMRHVQALLAPGGLAVLLEGTGPQDWIDLTFGLTEGWWKFTDRDLRQDYPLLGTERWVRLLDELGFAAAAGVPSDKAPDAFLSRQAIILAETPSAAGPAGQAWAILTDGGELGNRVADSLVSAGHSVVKVKAGQDYGKTADGMELDPCRPEHFHRLIGDLEAEFGDNLSIVDLWPAGVPSPSEEAPEPLEDRQVLACQSALHLVQAAARSGRAVPPRVWLVTRAAAAVDAAAQVSLLQAPVWGLGKVVSLEHPELRCVNLDLDPRGSPDEAGFLADELQSAGRENQIALRGDKRYVARLVAGSGPAQSTATWPFHADGSYLITGGFAGLGLLVAQWMADHGAGHLVLMGRSGASADADTAIAALRASGVRVTAVCGDVSSAVDVSRAIAEAQSGGARLRGIVHSAGVLDDGVLMQQTWSRFAAVMRPKVGGAWNLHVLTRRLPLDFFVMFSSAAALLGSSGQSNHAAANAFLDALAHFRRAQALPALSINWGVWSEIGSAARRGVAQRVSGAGMGSISPREGLRALQRLMRDGALHAAVLPVQDWVRLMRDYASGSQPPFLAEIQRRTAAAGPQQPRGQVDWIARLNAAPAAGRPRILLGFVRAQACKVLALDESAHIDTRQPLNELGLDSLMAVELRHTIAAAIGRPLPATLLFNYPTIDALTNYLCRDVLAIDGSQPEAAASEVQAGGALEDVRDEDLAAMFARKLASVREDAEDASNG